MSTTCSKGARCPALPPPYESIHRRVGAFCCIGETNEQARAKFPAALLGRHVAAGALIDSPATIRQRLAELEAIGVQEMILGFPDILQLDTLRFFAQELI